jgi:predicted metal-dependent RNase
MERTDRIQKNIDFYLEEDEELRNRNITLDKGEIMIEAEDPVLLVDKRAIYMATILIAKTCDGTISMNKKHWVSVDEFSQMVHKTINTPFKDAVEISLREAMIVSKDR